MRKPIPKSVRKLVYAKYDGHCAYCGCKIQEKGFNVDHLYCLRNYQQSSGRRYGSGLPSGYGCVRDGRDQE